MRARNYLFVLIALTVVAELAAAYAAPDICVARNLYGPLGLFSNQTIYQILSVGFFTLVCLGSIYIFRNHQLAHLRYVTAVLLLSTLGNLLQLLLTDGICDYIQLDLPTNLIIFNLTDVIIVMSVLYMLVTIFFRNGYDRDKD